MKINIYQINTDKDENRVGFMGTGFLESKGLTVDASIYDKVYSAERDSADLEDLFREFNFHHPSDYKGRSMSVSDVITIDDKAYFCDSFGFKEVPAEKFLELPDKEQESDKIKVVMVEAGKKAKITEIDRGLESMQSIVGGYIEEYCPFEDEVAIICNEEGKFTGLPLNRAIRSEGQYVGYQEGEIVDIIAGNFFVAYAPVESENFESLPDELAQKYLDKFELPERFYKEGNKIEAVKYNPKESKPVERD